MTIANLEDHLRSCKKYVKNTPDLDDAIKHFLAQFLTVRIHAEYEIEIKRLIKRRAEKTGDMRLANLIEKRVGVRSMAIDDIKGNILMHLSPDKCKSFQSKINQIKHIQLYKNIVTNRHSVSHGDGFMMTFDEVVKAHDTAKEVMDAISWELQREDASNGA